MSAHNDELQAVDSVIKMHNIVAQLKNQVFKSGVDYGVIPGSAKPTLLLPGMEKIMCALNLRVEYREVARIVDYERNIFHYEYEAILINKETLRVEACAIGLATSRESKWRWREAKRICPVCGKDSIRKSKNEGEGWYCWSKLGGCGATFTAADARITGQTVGRVENEDIADQINTICKIAQKRAFASAIKAAANVSEWFTVDIEDTLPRGDVIEDAFPDAKKPAPTKPTDDEIRKFANYWKERKFTSDEIRALVGAPAAITSIDEANAKMQAALTARGKHDDNSAA